MTALEIQDAQIEQAINMVMAEQFDDYEDAHPEDLKTRAAQRIYMTMLGYLEMVDDPKYRAIHKWRKQIDQLKDAEDRKNLIKYFEREFGGAHTAHTTAWEYYKDPE